MIGKTLQTFQALPQLPPPTTPSRCVISCSHIPLQLEREHLYSLVYAERNDIFLKSPATKEAPFVRKLVVADLFCLQVSSGWGCVVGKEVLKKVGRGGREIRDRSWRHLKMTFVCFKTYGELPCSVIVLHALLHTHTHIMQSNPSPQVITGCRSKWTSDPGWGRETGIEICLFELQEMAHTFCFTFAHADCVSFSPTLPLVPLRLGGTQLNPKALLVGTLSSDTPITTSTVCYVWG